MPIKVTTGPSPVNIAGVFSDLRANKLAKAQQEARQRQLEIENAAEAKKQRQAMFLAQQAREDKMRQDAWDRSKDQADFAASQNQQAFANNRVVQGDARADAQFAQQQKLREEASAMALEIRRDAVRASEARNRAKLEGDAAKAQAEVDKKLEAEKKEKRDRVYSRISDLEKELAEATSIMNELPAGDPKRDGLRLYLQGLGQQLNEEGAALRESDPSAYQKMVQDYTREIGRSGILSKQNAPARQERIGNTNYLVVTKNNGEEFWQKQDSDNSIESLLGGEGESQAPATNQPNPVNYSQPEAQTPVPQSIMEQVATRMNQLNAQSKRLPEPARKTFTKLKSGLQAIMSSDQHDRVKEEAAAKILEDLNAANLEADVLPNGSMAGDKVTGEDGVIFQVQPDGTQRTLGWVSPEAGLNAFNRSTVKTADGRLYGYNGKGEWMNLAEPMPEKGEDVKLAREQAGLDAQILREEHAANQKTKEMEMQFKQAEQQLKFAAMSKEMQMKQQQAQMDMQMKQQQAQQQLQLQAQQGQQEFAISQVSSQQQLQNDQASGQQKLEHAQQHADLKAQSMGGKPAAKPAATPTPQPATTPAPTQADIEMDAHVAQIMTHPNYRNHINSQMQNPVEVTKGMQVKPGRVHVYRGQSGLEKYYIGMPDGKLYEIPPETGYRSEIKNMPFGA